MNFTQEILQKLKILYVEDDLLARDEIAEFLDFEIGKVELASNGKEGLEKFKTFKPHIVITDINMPQMNGLDMAKEIKKISPKTPIIITSAYSDNDFIIKAIEIGISRYILKPIDMDELLAMIIKSAKELLFEDTIQVHNEYIKFLIDSNPSFMLVLTKKEMEHINSTFLEFLGYKSEEDFLKDYKNINNLIVPSISELIENIIEYKKGEYVVIKKDGKAEKFLVQYREFSKMNKNIFIFLKITKEDEFKILLKKALRHCPEKLQEEIKKVLDE